MKGRRFLFFLAVIVFLFGSQSFSGAQQDCNFIFQDNFDDGNDDGWTVHQLTWQVVNGEYYYGNNNNDDGLTVAGYSIWEDYTYEFRFKILTGSQSPQVYMVFRFSEYFGYNRYSAYNFYYRPSIQKWVLSKNTSSADGIQIAEEANPSTIDYEVWYYVKIEVNGQNIKCYVNDQLKIDVNDSTYSHGAIGLRGDMSKIVFDDIKVYSLPPGADAGENISILSEQQCQTVINGMSYSNNGFLTYRWLENTNELLPSTNVGLNGESPLDLCAVPSFSIGEHTLTLEVSDGCSINTDEMILTVSNSTPHPAPTGGGVYQINTPITLGGWISDFDGDSIYYEWQEGSEILFFGNIDTNYGGVPVDLPDHNLVNLSLGEHTLTLFVSDGINDPVTSDVFIEVIDTSAPTLAPVPNLTILWPPNHKMVDITIQANASDNSGDPVTLSASVGSNEPQSGLGDWDISPDWTQSEIDQTDGIIKLKLRAERSDSGSGRIYTITITAEDDSGNSSTAQIEILVPHDNRKK